MRKEDITDEWLTYARTDLSAAKHLTQMAPQPMEIICFHCQQSAEKALKAYLTTRDIRPPKTHDLDELLALAGKNKAIENLREETIYLNDYSVMIRYPGERIIEEKDLHDALVSAEKILKTIEAEIKS